MDRGVASDREGPMMSVGCDDWAWVAGRASADLHDRSAPTFYWKKNRPRSTSLQPLAMRGKQSRAPKTETPNPGPSSTEFSDQSKA